MAAPAVSTMARSSATSVGRAHQQGNGVAPGDVVEQWQQLVADTVAHEAGDRGCWRRGPGRVRGEHTAPPSPGVAAASSGRVGAGPIAASPSSPAPRSRLMSTVSARSSAVCPVNAPGGNAARRAAARVPRRLVRQRSRRRPRRTGTPSAPARATARSASAAELGRRPWSTCTASTASPAAVASARSAVESAPPEKAQVTAVEGGGNEQRASSSSSTGSYCWSRWRLFG